MHAHTASLLRRAMECKRMKDFDALFEECWNVGEIGALLMISGSRPWKKKRSAGR